MSRKRHIVYAKNVNTRGETYVGDSKQHLGSIGLKPRNTRLELGDINARFVGVFHSLRRMVFCICQKIRTPNSQRSQNSMGDT